MESRKKVGFKFSLTFLRGLFLLWNIIDLLFLVIPPLPLFVIRGSTEKVFGAHFLFFFFLFALDLICGADFVFRGRDRLLGLLGVRGGGDEIIVWKTQKKKQQKLGWKIFVITWNRFANLPESESWMALAARFFLDTTGEVVVEACAPPPPPLGAFLPKKFRMSYKVRVPKIASVKIAVKGSDQLSFILPWSSSLRGENWR